MEKISDMLSPTQALLILDNLLNSERSSENPKLSNNQLIALIKVLDHYALSIEANDFQDNN